MWLLFFFIEFQFLDLVCLVNDSKFTSTEFYLKSIRNCLWFWWRWSEIHRLWPPLNWSSVCLLLWQLWEYDIYMHKCSIRIGLDNWNPNLGSLIVRSRWSKSCMNDMLLTVEKNESVTWKSLKHQRGGQGLPLLLTPASYGRMDLRRVMAWTSKRGRKFTMDVPMELQIDKTPNSLVTKKQSWYKSHCFHGSSICFLPFSLGFNSKGFAREEGSKNLGSQISPCFKPINLIN